MVEVLDTGTFHRILVNHPSALNENVESADLSQVPKERLEALFKR